MSADLPIDPLPAQVTICEAIARDAHAFQTRRGGAPYIDHPARIAAMFHGEPLMQAIAWLHDVIEDTFLTFDDLRADGVIPGIIDIVDILTRRPEEEYHHYLQRIHNNGIARLIKVADIVDNLTDQPTTTQIERYKHALVFLAR